MKVLLVILLFSMVILAGCTQSEKTEKKEENKTVAVVKQTKESNPANTTLENKTIIEEKEEDWDMFEDDLNAAIEDLDSLEDI